MRKMAGAKFELISDIDMYQFVEKVMRVGISSTFQIRNYC